MTLLVAVLYIVDRLMSQTADENIPSSVGVFQCCTLLSCNFSFYIFIYFIFISAVVCTSVNYIQL